MQPIFGRDGGQNWLSINTVNEHMVIKGSLMRTDIQSQLLEPWIRFRFATQFPVLVFVIQLMRCKEYFASTGNFDYFIELWGSKREIFATCVASPWLYSDMAHHLIHRFWPFSLIFNVTWSYRLLVPLSPLHQGIQENDPRYSDDRVF